MDKPCILFDTDMESDCDDAGALALLLYACRAGEAQLLGVIADAPGACVAPCCELFRRHYAVAFHGILGFVLASTLVIIPTEYGPGEPLLSALCCVGGFLLAFLLARLDKKIQT